MTRKMGIFTTKPSMPPIEEYMTEISSIWDSCWLTNMGEKHLLFEHALQAYLEVEQITLTNNGHMALELALRAMQLNGEVITTPFTFASTTHAIIRNQLTPVFCDISYDNFTIDEQKIEALITEKTCAIVPVHVYGNVCNVKEIERIAKKYGLKVVYDAAHAFGVSYEGRGIGCYGDASMFSFHATKVFNSIEGGAVCYKDKAYKDRLNGMKNFGIHDSETVDMIGVNAKMNEFQAAMGICNLRHMPQELAKRKSIVERYKQHLSKLEGIRLSGRQKDVSPNFAYFPIVIEESLFGATRDQLCSYLEEHGVYARKYFYPLTSAFDCYKHSYDAADTPIALWVSQHVLTLPLYADLTIEEVDEICDLITLFHLKSKGKQNGI